DGRHVLLGAAGDDHPAGVIVDPEAEDVAGEFVHVQADGVGSEPSPVGEAAAGDRQVAESDGAEDVRGVHRSRVRKSTVSRLNRSGASHWTQWPTPDAR